MWLSYSAYSQWNKCGKQYRLDRISDKEPPVRDSKHNAIVGSVTQRIFEDFYNEKMWKINNGLVDELHKRAEVYLDEFVADNYINWSDFTCRFKSKYEPLKEIQDIIPKTIKGISREKLVGPYAVSELELKVPFGEDYLYGFIDFIIRQEDGTLLLLDGKSSRHYDKYVNPEQLYYYSLMFFLRYHKIPDKLGFFFYRYADDPDKAIQWHPIDKARVRDIKEDIQRTMTAIHNRKFEANPEPSHCNWCVWSQICDERQEQKRQNKAKRRMNSKKKEIKVDEDEDFIGFDALK